MGENLCEAIIADELVKQLLLISSMRVGWDIVLFMTLHLASVKYLYDLLPPPICLPYCVKA